MAVPCPNTNPAESGLVTSRRNFFTRAFGLTVAGATVSLPVLTLATAAERVEHHRAGLEAALRDLYPDARLHFAAKPLGKGDYPFNACYIFNVDADLRP